MTRKRSKLKMARTKTRSKTRSRFLRKTHRGGSGKRRTTNTNTKLNVMKIVTNSGFLNNSNSEAAKKAVMIEDANEGIDDRYSQPLLRQTTQEITQQIYQESQNIYEQSQQSQSQNHSTKVTVLPCSSITNAELTILSNSLCAVERDYEELIRQKYETEFERIADEFATLGNEEWENPEPPDKRLYRLFYQIMTEKQLDDMIKQLMRGYSPNQPGFLIEEYKKSRLGELVHSYMYKIFAGIATKYAMTDTVLKYTSPGGGPFSELRNLCLVMRDILGLVNHVFRKNLKIKLGDIGDTQYCHSGGNMFYVMAMMICYIHTRHYRGNRYIDVTQYDPTDILGQIMLEFDTSLGDEIVCFYQYLHALMNDAIFTDLLKKITSSMSDLDFLCLTSRDELVNGLDEHGQPNPNRETLRDITYLMGGILLQQCGNGLKSRVNNIALNVILPDRKPKDSTCGLFKTSIRYGLDPIIKVQVETLLSPYLEYLNGIKLSTNKIDIIKIYLIRIKVAMEEECISNELRKIFAEKLDFVIGSLESGFYCYKQCKFKNCEYYSLETFLHELKDILTTSQDDKSDKRMVRYQFFNILSYIDKHKPQDKCLPEKIVQYVNAAIAQADNMESTHEDRCDSKCNTNRGRGAEEMNHARSLPGQKCWFNLLFGIIFKFLDPTTRNRSAKGCVMDCSPPHDDLPPPPPVFGSVPEGRGAEMTPE